MGNLNNSCRTSFAVIVVTLFAALVSIAEATEPLHARTPGDVKLAVVKDSLLIDEERKGNVTTLPNGGRNRLAATTEVNVEIRRRFNELQRQLLDERARVVDWWLVVIGLVLTFFGIVVAIAGIMGFRRFREIETEARNSIQRVADLEVAAKGHLGEIANIREKSDEIIQRMNAKLVVDEPDGVGRAVKNVQNNPKASLIDKAVAHAALLQRQGNRDDAVKKWRAIARIAEDTDNYLAARAWFSVGYLFLFCDPKASILANDRAIRLKPDLAEAFVNRGTAKQQFNQYEAAIADYDEAIRLQQNFAEAYSGRASARLAMQLYDESIADCNLAIRLKPDYAEAYYNRGTSKVALKRFDEAIDDFSEAVRLKADYVEAIYNLGTTMLTTRRHEEAVSNFDEAIRMRPDFSEAYANRGVSKVELGLKSDARIDLETAFNLARKRGDGELESQVEELLRNLDA